MDSVDKTQYKAMHRNEESLSNHLKVERTNGIFTWMIYCTKNLYLNEHMSEGRNWEQSKDKRKNGKSMKCKL